METHFLKSMHLSFSFIVVLLCSNTFYSCSTSSIQIQSNPPGAEVLLIKEGNQTTRVGVTPVQFTNEQVTLATKQNTEIRISKEGYESENILAPTSSFGSDTKIDLTLKVNKFLSNSGEESNKLNELSEKVAEAQRLIYKKDYAQSKKILDGLTDKYPRIFAVHSLLGNVLFLQKNYAEALIEYKKAKEIRPDDQSINRMIIKVTPLLGGSTL